MSSQNFNHWLVPLQLSAMTQFSDCVGCSVSTILYAVSKWVGGGIWGVYDVLLDVYSHDSNIVGFPLDLANNQTYNLKTTEKVV